MLIPRYGVACIQYHMLAKVRLGLAVWVSYGLKRSSIVPTYRFHSILLEYEIFVDGSDLYMVEQVIVDKMRECGAGWTRPR